MKPMLKMVLSILDTRDGSSIATFLPEDCESDDPLQMTAALVQCVTQFMVDSEILRGKDEVAVFLGEVAESLKGATIEMDNA
jgi:hypothetical protein